MKIVCWRQNSILFLRYMEHKYRKCGGGGGGNDANSSEITSFDWRRHFERALFALMISCRNNN
jgi:hypothetical protein